MINEVLDSMKDVAFADRPFVEAEIVEGLVDREPCGGYPVACVRPVARVDLGPFARRLAVGLPMTAWATFDQPSDHDSANARRDDHDPGRSVPVSEYETEPNIVPVVER